MYYDEYEAADEYDEYYDAKHTVWGETPSEDTAALLEEYDNFSELADPSTMFHNCLLPTFETAGLQLAETLALCAVYRVVLSQPSVRSSGVYRNYANLLLGLVVLYRYIADLLFYVALYTILLLLLLGVCAKSRYAFASVLTVAIATITCCEHFLPHFIQIRSVFMLMSIKVLSVLVDMKASLPLSFDLLGYLYNPGTVLFGPFVSYKQHLDSMEKPASLNLLQLGKFSSFVILYLAATCAVMIFPTGSFRLAYVYRDALNFRVSHYFISYTSVVTYLLCGFSLEGHPVLNPLAIEVPYSLKQVTAGWNRPLSNFLNTYVFRHLSHSNMFYNILLTYVISCGLHGFNVYISEILLSLAVFSYIEYKLRAKLANTLDACVRSEPCDADCIAHAHTSLSLRALFLNAGFLLVNVFHLAYLGCVLNNIEMLTENGMSLEFIPSRWGNMGYVSHYIAFAMYIVYIVL